MYDKKVIEQIKADQIRYALAKLNKAKPEEVLNFYKWLIAEAAEGAAIQGYVYGHESKEDYQEATNKAYQEGYKQASVDHRQGKHIQARRNG